MVSSKRKRAVDKDTQGLLQLLPSFQKYGNGGPEKLSVSPSYLGIMNMLAVDSARHCHYPLRMCFSWWERMNPLISQGVSLLTHLLLLVRSYVHLLILLSFPLSALSSSALPNLWNSQQGLQSAFSLPSYGITPPAHLF